MKRVVSALDGMQLGPVAQSLAHGAQELRLSELVACSLQKQHRQRDRAKVTGSLGRRFSGGVKGKTKEHQAVHS